MIEEYLAKRDSLVRTFMLVDIRHKPSEADVLMYKYLKYYNLPVTVVATKVDKLSNNKKAKAKKLVLDTLQLEQGDSFVMFSNITKEGKEEVLKEIGDLVGEETL